MSTSSTKPILVTGATGNTGSTLLRLLEERGVAVRAMVRHERDIARLGNTSASIVIGDFDDAASIAAALDGVAAAYLVTPSSVNAEAQQIRFAELAAAANVKHLVKLSQFAADEASPVRFLRYHAAVERRIRELGIGYTFLRPNLYFQGFLAFQAMIAKEGRLFAPIGNARISAVDVRDIAGVAATVLTQPGHTGKTYTITGPRAVTHAEIAQAIAAAIGREVSFVDVPPEAFAGALIQFGMPEWQVGGLIEDYAHYARGEATIVSPAVREITDAEPRDVTTFARDYASAFIAKEQTITQQSHPYIGMWVTQDGHVRQELLPNGRYDEARGAKQSAYQDVMKSSATVSSIGTTQDLLLTASLLTMFYTTAGW